jgi:hypothetical protein
MKNNPKSPITIFCTALKRRKWKVLKTAGGFRAYKDNEIFFDFNYDRHWIYAYRMLVLNEYARENMKSFYAAIEPLEIDSSILVCNTDASGDIRLDCSFSHDSKWFPETIKNITSDLELFFKEGKLKEFLTEVRMISS